MSFYDYEMEYPEDYEESGDDETEEEKESDREDGGKGGAEKERPNKSGGGGATSSQVKNPSPVKRRKLVEEMDTVEGPPASNTFDGLNEDCLLHIGKYLDKKSLEAVGSVHKRWRLLFLPKYQDITCDLKITDDDDKLVIHIDYWTLNVKGRALSKRIVITKTTLDDIMNCHVIYRGDGSLNKHIHYPLPRMRAQDVLAEIKMVLTVKFIRISMLDPKATYDKSLVQWILSEFPDVGMRVEVFAVARDFHSLTMHDFFFLSRSPKLTLTFHGWEADGVMEALAIRAQVHSEFSRYPEITLREQVIDGSRAGPSIWLSVMYDRLSCVIAVNIERMKVDVTLPSFSARQTIWNAGRVLDRAYKTLGYRVTSLASMMLAANNMHSCRYRPCMVCNGRMTGRDLAEWSGTDVPASKECVEFWKELTANDPPEEETDAAEGPVRAPPALPGRVPIPDSDPDDSESEEDVPGRAHEHSDDDLFVFAPQMPPRPRPRLPPRPHLPRQVERGHRNPRN